MTIVGMPQHASRAWVAGTAALMCGVAALAIWVTTPVPRLRAELQGLQFWTLEACVFLGLALTAAVLQELADILGRRDVAVALSLGALATCLALSLPPRMHRIFYDEQIYQSVGQNLADSKRAQVCNDGAIGEGRLRCFAAEYNKQPYAYPHILSLAYRTFGVRPAIPFAVNAAAMGLTVSFVYLLALALFADRIAAACAAVILSLTPEQLIWSATAASEPTASLAAVAAVLAAACFVRSRSNAALAGMAVASAYAIQFRPESLLIVPIVVLLLWQFARDEFTRPRLLWAALLFLAFASVHAAHLAAVRNEGWGTTGERLSIAYVRDNLRVNGWFFLGDPRFPAAFTLLAAIGWAVRPGAPGRATLAAYFALFFGLPLFFYAGSYDYGADVRYSLAAYPPLAILAGLGVSAIARRAERIVPRRAMVAVMVAAAAAMFTAVYLPIVRSRADSAWAARADVDFARSFVRSLPPGAYVLTHNPGMFHLWGVSAGQMSLASSAGTVDMLGQRYTGGVYLHWNYWCNTDDPAHRALCDRVKNLRPTEAAGEYRLNDQHFVFYRLAARLRAVAP